MPDANDNAVVVALAPSKKFRPCHLELSHCRVRPLPKAVNGLSVPLVKVRVQSGRRSTDIRNSQMKVTRVTTAASFTREPLVVSGITPAGKIRRSVRE